VLAYLDALSNQDIDRVLNLVSVDFVNEHTSRRGSSLTGREIYGERLPSFLADFSGLHYDVEDLVVEDDRVCAAYRLTANFLGAGSPAVPVVMRGVFRFIVRDGQIAHRIDYFDGEVFQSQIDAARRAEESGSS